jgi:hypothetical protein
MGVKIVVSLAFFMFQKKKRFGIPSTHELHGCTPNFTQAVVWTTCTGLSNAATTTVQDRMADA